MDRDRVIRYCEGELETNHGEAERLFVKVSKYEDIYGAFLNWLDKRDFGDDLRIEGYTSAGIHRMAPELSGIGVYNFMVTLRDEPGVAREIIRGGFRTE